MIHNVLRNENYVGNIVYNRTSRRLGQKQVRNPNHLWVRSGPVLEPVVDSRVFARAQKIMAERYVSIPEDEMLLRLRIALHRAGSLSSGIIRKAAGVPSASAYIKHFGSLRNAFELIGYVTPRDCDWIDTRSHWSGVLNAHALRVADALKNELSVDVSADGNGFALLANGKRKVLFLVARRLKTPRQSHAAQWRVSRRQMPCGLLAVLRLDDTNKAIQDFVLLPYEGKRIARPYLTLSDLSLVHQKAVRFEQFDELIRELKARFKKQRSR